MVYHAACLSLGAQNIYQMVRLTWLTLPVDSPPAVGLRFLSSPSKRFDFVLFSFFQNQSSYRFSGLEAVFCGSRINE